MMKLRAPIATPGVFLLMTLAIVIGVPDHSTSEVTPNGNERVGLVRDIYPGWSPDGDRILFASNRDEENHEDFNLYLIDPDGFDLVKITETIPHVEQIRPMYSPNGKSIIYNRQYLDGQIEVHLLTLNRDR